jgi:3-isopropylmalate/(R)-2-methylmalate dehydratase large subunit
MGKSLAVKVLERIVGTPLRPGEIVWVEPELAILHDVNSVNYFHELEEMGIRPRYPDRAVVVMDHLVPVCDSWSKRTYDYVLEAGGRLGVKVYGVGDNGIGHQLPADRGLVRPGMLVVTSDAHGPTLGGTGALVIPIGVGMRMVLALGRTWLRVPETLRVDLSGTLPSGVLSRDVAQYVGREIGFDEADFRVIEFGGPLMQHFGLDERMTLCNVMADLGAKTAIVAADDGVCSLLEQRTSERVQPLSADPEGFELRRSFDVSELEPMIAVPPGPEHVFPLREMCGKRIQQAYVGSCAGGRMEDLRAAASVLRDRQVAPGVRLFIVPSSVDIYAEAEREGLLGIFVRSGATVLPACCALCYDRLDLLSEGEVSLGTGVRNEPGQGGCKSAEVYLASAATVAASAVAGCITDPRRFLTK